MSLELISLETVEEFARQYGYWAVLGGILLENLGLPLPGESIVLVGGFLSGSGDLRLWAVWTCAIAGSVVGSTIGYWIGVYGGWPLVKRISHLFRIEEEALQGLRERFSNNAPKAVFVGRFITLLRIFAGPLAGIVGMPFLKFMTYNLAGALVWASVTVGAAYIAGQLVDLQQMAQWAGQFSFLIVGAVIAVLALPQFMKLARRVFLKPVGESEAQ